jgi:hypothetical protein
MSSYEGNNLPRSITTALWEIVERIPETYCKQPEGAITRSKAGTE